MTPDSERRELLERLQREALAALALREAEAARRDWSRIAKPYQREPEADYVTWLSLGGRGSGKTKTGAETVKKWVHSGRYQRIALIAPTTSDVRDVMVEGVSGILSLYEPGDPERPVWESTKRRITWEKFGAYALTFSAEEPERLRGPNFQACWCDELCAWWNAQATWDMLQFAVRLKNGPINPRFLVTTTPKPIKLLRDLLKQANEPVTDADGNPTGQLAVIVSKSTTYDNRDNLAPTFFNQIIKKYEGTRLGRQELNAEILSEESDALWNLEAISRLRVPAAAPLRRIVVGVDPAASSAEGANETGIVVVGAGEDGHGYLLADRSLRGRPEQWAAEVQRAFDDFNADGIVAEKNQGGEMVRAVIHAHNQNLPVRLVWASKNKTKRAEPVSMMYEQGRFHHVAANPAGEKNDFTLIEDEMCAMYPNGEYLGGEYGSTSPDRADALVWAATELFFERDSGSIQFLPEFRREQHIVTDASVPGWSERWVGAHLGPISAALWVAQRQQRVYVLAEKVLENVSAEELGAEIAKEKETFAGDAKVVNLWMDKRHFDPGIGAKSVALRVEDGINRILGEKVTFTWALNHEERHDLDVDRRIQSFERRKKDVEKRRVTILSASDDAAAAWQHFRGLLRYWPLSDAGKLTYDHEFAMDLRGRANGPELLRAYVAATSPQRAETLPKFVISVNCPRTAAAMGALVRDDAQSGLPVLEGEAGALAAALLNAIIGHRAAPEREKAEALIERRIESVLERRPDAGEDVLWMVRQKAIWDSKAKDAAGKVYRFERRPQRMRRIA